MGYRVTQLIALWGAAQLGCSALECPVSYHTGSSTAIRDTEAARLANERGLTSVSDGDFERAEKAFREALRADVGYAAVHNNLGLVLLEKGRYHAAATEFSLASKLRPLSPEPLINLGRLYETVGWPEAAASEYERVLALPGKHEQALGRLAHLNARLGKEQEALPLLRRLARCGVDSEWKAWALARLPAGAGSGAR